MNDSRRPAVFLDRDGTINVEKEYLHRPEDLELIAGVGHAIAQLNRAGFLVVVVTNQSGVARAYFSVEDVNQLHQVMQQRLAAYDAHIDAFYLCPHHPDKGLDAYRIDCDCRKGKPGMLLRAAADLNIDLSASFMVGDKDADLIAGIAAGCRPYLVTTGYGEDHRNFALAHNIDVYKDLGQAVNSILASSG
ncbi:MAG: D-glycero-beta-D-manno-heptose 1,7-bisphosphate 7-phosphatase [Pelovirga sp.]